MPVDVTAHPHHITKERNVMNSPVLANSLKYSFKRSIPIMVGFFPVGDAYGILMATAGYSFIWSGFVSLFVYAGSLQMLMISFFQSDMSIFTIIVILIEQMKGAGSVLPAVIAAAASVLMIMLFGADSFLLPALALTVIILVLLRPRLEKKEGET